MKRPAILLLGAPGTGKSRLTTALQRALQASGREVRITTADMPPLRCAAAGEVLTLLMGLDVPTAQQEAADAALRTALSAAGVPYQVLHGQPDERLTVALDAVETLFSPDGRPPRLASGVTVKKAWVWLCDKCSDPQCEHRLLTDLLARRGETP